MNMQGHKKDSIKNENDPNKESLKDSACLQANYFFEENESLSFESYLGHYSYSATRSFISFNQKFILIFTVLSFFVLFSFFPGFISCITMFAGSALHFLLTLTKKMLFSYDVPQNKTTLREDYIKSNSNTTRGEHNNSEQVPLYTILLPVFMEEQSVLEQLFTAIYNLDYPKDKLQVLLLIESIDQETKNHIKNITTPLNYEMIVVPDFMPRTKAKACNYALKFALGNYLVIFDADDIPDCDQLKVVLQAFKSGNDSKIACLQAKLNYYNANENLLTRLFSIEYSILFDRLLPALASKDYPLPLGGTSNHFKSAILKELRGWDIYNLTEDAEIGMRLAMHGYKTRVIDSYTAEEAPITYRAWIKQRSRWLKGFIQTYLLYLQKNHNLSNQIGFKRSFISLHFMLGLSTLSLLCTPLMICIGVLVKLNLLEVDNSELIIAMTLSSGAFWIITTFSQTVIVLKESSFLKNLSFLKKLTCFFAFSPYFILHTIAVFNAILDLIRRPFYWNKTKHGVTNTKPLVKKQ